MEATAATRDTQASGLQQIGACSKGTSSGRGITPRHCNDDPSIADRRPLRLCEAVTLWSRSNRGEFPSLVQRQAGLEAVQGGQMWTACLNQTGWPFRLAATFEHSWETLWVSLALHKLAG